MAGGMNKAVLALSLVMAAFVVGTIGTAVVQFMAAAEGGGGPDVASPTARVPTEASRPPPDLVRMPATLEPLEPPETPGPPDPPESLAAPTLMNASAAPSDLHRLVDIDATKLPGKIRLGEWSAMPAGAPSAPPPPGVAGSVGTASSADTSGPALTPGRIGLGQWNVTAAPPGSTPAFSAPAKIRLGEWDVTTPLVRIERNASIV